MSAQNTLGLFSEPGYITIGAPYEQQKGAGKLSRYYGKQFGGAL